MSNVTVSGFDYVSFWREEELGIIVLRTDSSGRISHKVMGELMMALGNATIDDEVRAVALTGQNFVFCKGLLDPQGDNQDLLEMARGLASTLASLEKPTFALINGDAFDFGYELALLADEIYVSKGSRVGFYREYSYILGGSLSGQRFDELSRVEAVQGRNCDKILERDTFLEDARRLIKNARSRLLVSRRKVRLKFLTDALNAEHLEFQKHSSKEMISKTKEGGN